MFYLTKVNNVNQLIALFCIFLQKQEVILYILCYLCKKFEFNVSLFYAKRFDYS